MDNEGMQQRVSDMFKGIKVDVDSGEIDITYLTEAQCCQRKRLEHVIDRLVDADTAIWEDYV